MNTEFLGSETMKNSLFAFAFIYAAAVVFGFFGIRFFSGNLFTAPGPFVTFALILAVNYLVCSDPKAKGVSGGSS